MDHDLIIIGAGPAGLSLARALRPTGLRTLLLEQQPRAALENPAFDGREIALTHHSAQLMRGLGMWSRLGEAHVAPLRDALVLDGRPGPGQARMTISHQLSPEPQLGFLVANHRIRRAAYEACFDPDGPGPVPELRADTQVGGVDLRPDRARVRLADGRTLDTRLVVAADSRHSQTRRSVGIPADLHDYGRSMLLLNMTHEQPHHETAWEWFDEEQTLALLPMNPCPQTGLPRSSAVLTLPAQGLAPLLALDDEALGAAMTKRFSGQLGTMRVASSRHVYPLVGVWARRFVATRFAAVGDAAVGMHPVTAHGFNLGLRSIDTLARLLADAHRRGDDLAAPARLARYEREHQGAARGIYLATHAVATLYTREHLPARWLRHTLVRAGERFTPFKRAVAASLTGLH